MKIKNLKLKIIFLGSSKFVIPILEVLRKNFDLCLVLTTEKNPTDAVPAFCIKNKISYLCVSSLSDPNLQSSIFNLQSSVAVLADFRLIIPTNILNSFPHGIINIHPSLLPKYRGPTPVQTAILNGEKVTGVSIMKLDEEIDHGPILGKAQEKILDTDTAESLYKRLFEIGASLLLKVLNKYLKGSLKPTAQNHKNATFTKVFKRGDGFIDFQSLKIDRMIRAYFPWPGVWTKWKMENGKWKILKFLPNNKLQVEGKKPMPYKDFLNGYPQIKQQLEKLLGQLI